MLCSLPWHMSENNTYHRGKSLEIQPGRGQQVRVATIKTLVDNLWRISNHARLKKPTRLWSDGKRLGMERKVSTL